MTNRFEQNLRAALHADAPHTEGMQQTATLAAQAAATHAPRERLRFAAFLGIQVRFIGWKIWLLQAFCLLAAHSVLEVLLGHYYFLEARIAAQCLGCLSVLVMLTALPFIRTATLYRMQELESATRCSSLRLLMAKLILVGLGDVAMLAALWIYALVCTPLSAQALPFCLFVPFLAAASGGLTLLTHVTPRTFNLASLGWCALLCIGCMLSGRWLALLTEIGPWLALLLLLYCGFALRRLWLSADFCELQLS